MDKWRDHPGCSSHLSSQNFASSATKKHFQDRKLVQQWDFKWIFTSLCRWHSKKRQKSALSGSCSVHHDVLCAALYISGIVRKKSQKTLSISSHFYPTQRREKILYFVNTSDLFCINMFVLFKGILNYASQFSHIA